MWSITIGNTLVVNRRCDQRLVLLCSSSHFHILKQVGKLNNHRNKHINPNKRHYFGGKKNVKRKDKTASDVLLR